MNIIKNNANLIIFYLSLGSFLGSMFFSNFLSLNPCELCWWQRILAYPILVISIYSLWTKVSLQKLILGFSIPGLFIATYHYILQMTNWVDSVKVCGIDSPCKTIDFLYAGFITIPLLSLVFFILVSIFALISLKPKN